MYSILVERTKLTHGGEVIMIGIKQDGIHESVRGSSLKIHHKEIDALNDFGRRAESIRLSTYGKKENEVL